MTDRRQRDPNQALLALDIVAVRIRLDTAAGLRYKSTTPQVAS